MKRRYTDNQLIHAVETSVTKAEILSKLNLKPNGGNYNCLDAHIARLNLNTSHILGRAVQRVYRGGGTPKKSYNEILIKESLYTNSGRLKKRLVDDGLLCNQCNICSISEWLGKNLVLHIDHINGDRQDNRIDNLRLLCPNCHSQTSTFCRGKRGAASENRTR